MLKKKKKKISLPLISGAMAATLLLTGCGGQAASSSQSASESAAAVSDSAAASSSLFASMTSEDLQKLVNGEVTLTELEEQYAEKAAQTPDSPTASETPASSGDTITSSTSESVSAAPKSDYEAELQDLIQQLYNVKAEAESSLNSAIAAAKAEYKALPAEKQTTTKKIAIVMGKTSELYKLQASCDKKVSNIVGQMRTLLEENGQSTALADQAQASYESQKKEMISSLTSELYG